jgi:hypothetical protein
MQRAKKESEFSDRLKLVRHERNYGKRVALASAVAHAQGEIVVCIDSDSFVDKDAIRLLVQPFRDNRVMAVSGHGEAINKDEGILPRLEHYWYAEMFRLLKGMESRFGCVSCCSGMLAAYQREAILPIINEWAKEGPTATAPIALDDVKRESWVSRGMASRLIKSPGEDRILTAFALSGNGARVVYRLVVAVYVAEVFPRFLSVLPVPVSAHLEPCDNCPVAVRRSHSGRMDGYRWLPRGNYIRRVSARTQYVEVSGDFNRICSVPNDVRLRLTFHYSYDLLVRVGHAMERRMAHKSRWDPSSLFNGTVRDSAS